MSGWRTRRDLRFVLAGAQYPQDFSWSENIYLVRHLPPGQHPAFFSSARLTLNVTRQDTAATGRCPSGRLFEAAACGTPIVTEAWKGLESFFEPDRELLRAQTANDMLAVLDRGRTELATMAARAGERVFGQHTSAHRAHELIRLLREAPAGHGAHHAAAARA